jgi:hypothetical protein
MTFFNQKENILELKLTNYGEDLLSKGKFKPIYYSFSDEGVNYGFVTTASEGQNDIDGRIKRETPYLRVQKNRFSNLLDEKTKNINIIGIDFETEIAKRESLGKCDTVASSSSRLKLFLLDNEIESFNNFYTASASGTQRDSLPIPQIDANLEFQTTIDSAINPTFTFTDEPELTIAYDSIEFPDGGYPYVGTEQLTMLLEEIGVATNFADFEIEVFEILEEENYLGDKQLRKLTFKKQIEDLYVDDNNLYRSKIDRDNDEALLTKYPVTTDNVEYYFNVYTDDYNEMPKDFICSLVGQLQTKDFALPASLQTLCPDSDVQRLSVENVYGDGNPPPECKD